MEGAWFTCQPSYSANILLHTRGIRIKTYVILYTEIRR